MSEIAKVERNALFEILTLVLAATSELELPGPTDADGLTSSDSRVKGLLYMAEDKLRLALKESQ